VGNTLGKKGGRPKGAKNILPKIRDRVFKEVYRRDLKVVSTETLLKFVAATLPKDMTLALSKPTEITYVSNTPRPELTQNNELVPINKEVLEEANQAVNAEVVDTQEVE
jgi:hypothetical protein